MTKRLEADFYALYRFKRTVQRCAQLAYALQTRADDMNLPAIAFTRLENADQLHKAWKTGCDDRKREAEALHEELNAVADALTDVAELYGWTDAELAAEVARAEKLR